MLKTALLPLLNNINKVLEKVTTEGWLGTIKAGGILLAAGGIWKLVTGSLSSTVYQLYKLASKKILGDKLDSVILKLPSSSLQLLVYVMSKLREDDTIVEINVSEYMESTNIKSRTQQVQT